MERDIMRANGAPGSLDDPASLAVVRLANRACVTLPILLLPYGRLSAGRPYTQ